MNASSWHFITWESAFFNHEHMSKLFKNKMLLNTFLMSHIIITLIISGNLQEARQVAEATDEEVLELVSKCIKIFEELSISKHQSPMLPQK